jgi:hypothetical protein
MYIYLYKKTTIYSKKNYHLNFLGANVLEPPVWDVGPNFKRRSADTPKTAQPAPCRHKFRGANEA